MMRRRRVDDSYGITVFGQPLRLHDAFSIYCILLSCRGVLTSSVGAGVVLPA